MGLVLPVRCQHVVGLVRARVCVCGMASCSAHALEEARQMASDWDTLEGLVGEPRFSVRKNASLLSHFYIEKSPDHFCQDRLGTNMGNVEEIWRCVQGVAARFKQQNVDALSFAEVIVGFYLNISGHHFG
jgi:hypothetical protein